MPFLLAWGYGAVFSALESRAGQRAAAPLMLLITGIWFVRGAVRYAQNDGDAPLAAVIDAARANGPVLWPPTEYVHSRVGYVVDRVASADDVVAVDLAYDSWTYPIFGKDFRRPVRFIPPAPAGRAVIPPDARWVAIDRGQLEKFVDHPDLSDLSLSMMWRYAGYGPVRPEDGFVYEQLLRDPSFELVFHDLSGTQSLFRRRAP